MMIDNEENFSEDERDELLKILAEVESALSVINYMEAIKGITGELPEEDYELEMKIQEKLEERRRNFDPDNYKKNTENEDNFEKPQKDEVRAMYKGIGKRAVIWKLKKSGTDIETTIKGDIEKIPYRDKLYVIADKDREEKDLDPNIVLLGDNIIKGNILIVEEKKGKLQNMNAETMMDIKHEMEAFGVRYIDDSTGEKEL